MDINFRYSRTNVISYVAIGTLFAGFTTHPFNQRLANVEREKNPTPLDHGTLML